MTTDLEEVRRRLRGWAVHFRDRARQGQAGSAEGLWKSPQIWEAQRPRPVYSVLEAIETQKLLQRIPTPNHRAICWRFAYPWLPVHIALRSLSRRVGYRVTLRVYDDLVLFGEHRLAVLIDREAEVRETRELLHRVVGKEKERVAAPL